MCLLSTCSSDEAEEMIFTAELRVSLFELLFCQLFKLFIFAERKTMQHLSVELRHLKSLLLRPSSDHVRTVLNNILIPVMSVFFCSTEEYFEAEYIVFCYAFVPLLIVLVDMYLLRTCQV